MLLKPADIEYYVKERLHPDIFRSLTESTFRSNVYYNSEILNARIVHITTVPDITFLALGSQYIPNIVSPRYETVKTEDGSTTTVKYYPPIDIEEFIENHVLQQNKYEYPTIALDLRCKQSAVKVEEKYELFEKHLGSIESYLDELIYVSLTCSKLISSTSILGVAIVENDEVSQCTINTEHTEVYLELLDYISKYTAREDGKTIAATIGNPELALLKMLKKYGAIINNETDNLPEDELKRLLMSYRFFIKRLLRHEFVSIQYEDSFYLSNYLINRYNRVFYRYSGNDKINIVNISDLPKVYERNEGNIELLVLSGDHMIEWRQPTDVYFIDEEFIFDKVYLVNVMNPNVLLVALIAAVNKLGLMEKYLGGVKPTTPRLTFINPTGNQFIKTMTVPIDKFMRLK